MRRYLFFLVTSTLLLLVGQPVIASSPLILPPGFVDEVVVNGLLSPRAFVFTPDGRILIAESGKEGSDDINFASIRVFKNGTLLTTRAYNLDICGDSERGFLGMALDPNFATNGYIYLYYTRQAAGGGVVCDHFTYQNPPLPLIGPRNRVSRVTMVGDTVTPGSEKILIDNIISDVGYHNAGDLHFDSQGYLYISVGDGGLSSDFPDTSPDPDMLNGKFLRIKPSDSDPRYYVTTGNPYDTAVGARTCGTQTPDADPAPTAVGSNPCREVYAAGFRNPFRFTIQPGTDIPFAGDVGGGAWEEVNKVTPGADYGFPVREGPCSVGVICSPPYSPTSYTNPVYAYAHVAVNAQGDSAIIGGDFYVGTGTQALDYPAQYKNNYFLADFVRGFIRRLAYNSGTDTWTAQLPEFATGGSGIIGLKTGPDANLYYLAFLDEQPPNNHISEIRRIRYVDTANQKPNAIASVNKLNGPVPGTVYTFSALGSIDPDHNVPLKYNWDFGDGQTISTTSLTVTHSYTTPDNRTVTLTATDYNGLGLTSDPVTLAVYPGNVPATGSLVLNNLSDPNRPTIYFAGDTWEYDASGVTDPDDSGTPPTVTWSFVFHHSTHTHPFIPIATAPDTFVIPDQAFETDTNVWFRAYLIMTDSRGQQTLVQRDILPKKSSLTIVTNPPGGQIILDGITYFTPRTINRVAGMHVTIGAPATQIFSSANLPFVRWSDGNVISHTVLMPSAPTTYTAFYATNTSPAANYYTAQPVVVEWNRIDWAVGYEVQIDDEPSFNLPLNTSPLLSMDTLSYNAPALPNGLYYWHVRAKKADGTFGNYGPTESFALVTP